MERYNLSEKELLSKLVLIEQHIGKCPSGFYEPSLNFNSSDEILIQKEASMMMKYVGLNHHVACITYVETETGTGGNVELDNSDSVFIDINRELKGQNAQVLAVMAHEICHKVLFVHGLFYPNLSFENEILTDLATIYVGFGKLSLNGCNNKRTVNCKEIKEGKDVETIKKITDSIGYLSLKQFAQAYNIVCGCNGTYSTMLHGLIPTARDMVIQNSFNIQSPITTTEIKQLLKQIQSDDAKTTNYIKTIEGILHDIKNRTKDNHTQYKKDFVIPFNLDSGSDIIDLQMKAAETLNRYNINNFNQKVDKLNSILRQLIIDYKKNYETNDSCLLNIECPCCGYIKNNGLKEHINIFVKCPSCGHYFVWNAMNDLNIETKEGFISKGFSDDEDCGRNKGKKGLFKLNYNKTIKFRENILRYTKYIFIISFILSFIPICVYLNIPWIYKVILVFPYTLIYYLFVKKLLPEDYNANYDVNGDYCGGDIKVGYGGISKTFFGNFGTGSNTLFSFFMGECGVHRTYVFLTFLIFMIPINCLVLREDTKPEDELANRERYKIYGTSKWYLLEIIFLYLIKYCFIAAIITILFFLGYLWDLFK